MAIAAAITEIERSVGYNHAHNTCRDPYTLAAGGLQCIKKRLWLSELRGRLMVLA